MYTSIIPVVLDCWCEMNLLASTGTVPVSDMNVSYTIVSGNSSTVIDTVSSDI